MKKKTKNKKVIYTVIIGDYDYLRTPKFVNTDYDYVCFTDNKKLKSKFWDIRLVNNKEHLDNVRLQRYIKICPHVFLPEYELSVYVDANVRIIGDFDGYIQKYMGNSGLLCVPHPDRSCIYKEAEECIRLGKDDTVIISSQVNGYRDRGYPENAGLAVTSVLVRDSRDARLHLIMDKWWHEVRTKSFRDQLSFNYICWERNFKYDLSDVHVFKNDYWVCPGIHTKNIEDVEDKLIDSMLLAAYRGYYIGKLEYELRELKEYKENILRGEKDKSDEEDIKQS